MARAQQAEIRRDGAWPGRHAGVRAELHGNGNPTARVTTYKNTL